MDDNKRIFETIIDVLRKANIGFSINEVKDIFFEPTKEDQKPKTDENEYDTPKKYEYWTLIFYGAGLELKWEKMGLLVISGQ